MMKDLKEKGCDILVAGGGILGVSIAFWLSEIYNASIILLDKEDDVARHTSSRNTGMIHRPFYLNPERKKVFAASSQKSYLLWSKLAEKFSLPWKPLGTLEVAMREEDVITLEKYRKWSLANGMREDETEILDRNEVKAIEPEVACAGAIHCKTDTCVSYGEFTHAVFRLAQENGTQFLGGRKVVSVTNKGDRLLASLAPPLSGREETLACRYFINAAGGGALDIAHELELGEEFTDLHFRGEYWIVNEPFASKIRKNVYSVAKYPEFPFLDPHLIVRVDGRREIGPNAVLVAGPGAYRGLSTSKRELVGKIFERPMIPKLKLFTSRRFLSLAWSEWRSSLSKKAMCSRVQKFIPSINLSYLTERGLAGIRSSLIDRHGFVPEAVTLESERSLHILNYNSPGATGAPAFSAHLVSELRRKGHLNGFAEKSNRRYRELWDYDWAKDF
jgi:L-2-hydroxyglutarate oxidase